MANIIGIHEIVNGPRNLVLNIDIEGDGSADETIPIAEADLHNCGTFRLDQVWAHLAGFEAYLEWDGPSKVKFLHIPQDMEIDQCFRRQGGITNPKMANYTGDVNLVTDGLGAGETGSIFLHFVKKEVPR